MCRYITSRNDPLPLVTFRYVSVRFGMTGRELQRTVTLRTMQRPNGFPVFTGNSGTQVRNLKTPQNFFAVAVATALGRVVASEHD